MLWKQINSGKKLSIFENLKDIIARHASLAIHLQIDKVEKKKSCMFVQQKKVKIIEFILK